MLKLKKNRNHRIDTLYVFYCLLKTQNRYTIYVIVLKKSSNSLHT